MFHIPVGPELLLCLSCFARKDDAVKLHAGTMPQMEDEGRDRQPIPFAWIQSVVKFACTNRHNGAQRKLARSPLPAKPPPSLRTIPTD
jgi:hypothetical protein